MGASVSCDGKRDGGADEGTARKKGASLLCMSRGCKGRSQRLNTPASSQWKAAKPCSVQRYGREPQAYLDDIKGSIACIIAHDGFQARWRGQMRAQGADSGRSQELSAHLRANEEAAMLSALMRVPRDLIGLCYAAAVHTVTVPPGINLIGLQALVDSPEVAVIDLVGEHVSGSRGHQLAIRRPVEIRNGTLSCPGSELELQRFDGRVFSRRAGLLIASPGVRLTDVTVTGCQGNEENRSYAVLAWGPAECRMERCAVVGNSWNGVWAFGNRARLSLRKVHISGCPGSGLGAWDGARVYAEDVLVEKCSFQAMEAVQQGTECTVVRGEFVRSHLGVNAFAGATVSLTGTSIMQNRQVGVRAVQAGTRVDVSGCTIAGNTLFALKADDCATISVLGETRVGPHQAQIIQINGGLVHMAVDKEGNIEADFAYLTDESRSARRAHCSSEGRGSCETTPGDPVSPRARGAMSESGASVAVSGAGSSGGDGGEGDMGVGGSGVSGVAVASSSARVWEAPMAVWSEEEEEDAQFVEEGLGESWRVGGG